MSFRVETHTFERVPLVAAGLCSSEGSRAVVVPVGASSSAAVLVDDQSGDGTGWSTAVIEVVRSTSAGGPWFPLASAVTFAAPGMSAAIDTAGAAYLAVRVNTPEGAARHVRIEFITKTEV